MNDDAVQDRMLVIIALSTIAIVWLGVLAIVCGTCLSAAAADRALRRRSRGPLRGPEPVRLHIVG